MPLLWLKIPNFQYTSLETFLEIIIMTGEPTQTTSKVLHTPVYQLSSEKQK